MLADRDAEKPNPETRMIWSGLLGINAADALPQDVQNVKSKLARMATTRNIPSAQIAISWVLQNDSVSVAVAGADSPSQLDDYISAVDVQMMPDELAELDQSSLGFTHLPLFAEIKPTNSPQRNS
jgi:aryl-alcohol dehydrogenase-like predicted oxidoreductase